MSSMVEEEAVDNRKKDKKKSKAKAKKGENKEHVDIMLPEVEQAHETERDDIVEAKMRKKKDKEKNKNKRKEDVGEGNVMDTVEEKMVDVYGEDSNGDGINNAEMKKRKKEKNKRKHEVIMNEVGGSIQGINENEGQVRPEEESVSKIKSNKESHEEEKNKNEMSSREDAVEKVERKKRKREKKKLDKADDSFGLVSNENSSEETLETLNEGRSDNSAEKVKKKEKKKMDKKIARSKDDEDVLPVPQNENTRENVEGSSQPALLEENATSKDGAEKVERKKRKREKKLVKDDDCFSRAGNENSSVEILEALNEGRSDNLAEKVKKEKKKDKKIARSKDDEGVLSVLQNENTGENVEGSPQPALLEENATSKIDKKKKSKKNKSLKDVPSVAKQDIPMQESADKNSNGQSNTDVQRDKEVEFAKRKKKKAKLVESVSEDPTPAKSNKKVRFSEEVEVFTLPDDPNTRNDGKDKLVQGKRFTKEEDEIVKEAVWNYIAEHELGDKGLDMVLNSRKHPQLRGCWKEIAAAIPYRPYSAFYARAQILFRRSEERKWTEEEKRTLVEYHKVHGNKFKELADELGKHRWHVKDAWRRMKPPNLRKGHWTQEEYQKLFDLVNKDLQLKAEEEKKSKHGMLRDNIAWSAISDQLSTRTNVLCCKKWYDQLRSPMVVKGVWADADDYRLVGALYNIDASCGEDVEWDDLLDDRSGDLCRERWNQMVLHIGEHGTKSFAEQVEILARRYCPYLFEVREAWDNKPVSD